MPAQTVKIDKKRRIKLPNRITNRKEFNVEYAEFAEKNVVKKQYNTLLPPHLCVSFFSPISDKISLVSGSKISRFVYCS